MRGSPSNAAARLNRWRMPSENPRVRRVAASLNPTSASASSTRRDGDAGGGGEDAQVVSSATAGVEARGFERSPDRFERLVELEEWAPEDRGGPCRGFYEAEQHAQRRGLAGTVRAEEAGDGSLGHGEAEIVNCEHFVKSLGKSGDFDGVGHVSQYLTNRARSRRPGSHSVLHLQAVCGGVYRIAATS